MPEEAAYMYTKALLVGDRRNKDSEGKLWEWGITVKEGWWKGRPPANPDKPRLSSYRGSTLPCGDWFLDIAIAFAALCPATRGLANTGSLAWYAHAPHITREQQALWLYYVEGLGSQEFREGFKRLSADKRSALLAMWRDNPGAYTVDDQSGDGLVAARLGIASRTAYDRRMRGVTRMVDFLQPVIRQERVA